MRERTPAIKLLFALLVGTALIIPLLMVYGLVSDRQHQARVAQDSISAGWGGQQVVSGPVLVIPYVSERTVTETVDGRTIRRTVPSREELFLSPSAQSVNTELEPERRAKSIYESVIFVARLSGEARFTLPQDLSRLGVTRSQMRLAEAEIRFGTSDPRGLQADAKLQIGSEQVTLKPGNGLNATGGAGFHGALEWDGAQPLDAQWSYSLRGSRALSLVPRGGETQWTVTSPWPHPSFGGSFLPDNSEIGSEGFTAKWSVADLALGQAPILMSDPGPPMIFDGAENYAAVPMIESARAAPGEPSGPSMAATIRLVEPVDLYSRVDRAVKYGFLFIGFTFLAFLMFDLIGGARVAAVEYLLTGAGLVLFFVLLLAFAELIGFAAAYALASIAIIGLLTAYSAAVLGSWKRARVIGALLLGLYALLYVLLNLEAWSLVIGSVLLFVALAGVMYATRSIDWSSVSRRGDDEDAREQAATASV